MKRLKSIDIFRGITMFVMIWIHLRLWWLREEDQWLVILTLPFTDRVFAPSFLFIAGISTTLFNRSRNVKVNKKKKFVSVREKIL